MAWIAERGSPVVDADGEVYMRGIHWDITERKQLPKAGDYAYFCAVHPKMIAMVHVTAP